MAALVDTRRVLLKFKGFPQLIPRRYRVKKKWAATLPRITSTKLALQNFDVNYGTQFGERWPSIRVSLLSEQKYGALINNFSSAQELMKGLELQGARDFVYEARARTWSPGSVGGKPRGDEELVWSSSLAAGQSGSEVPLSSQVGEGMEMAAATEPPSLSPNIKCFTFPKGDITGFSPARLDGSGLLGYYLLDAASVLPVLALDVQPGHTVLDLCAAPGGKTLALIQTQACWRLAANDSSVSRTGRLRRILQSYIPREHSTEDRVRITSFDGRRWGELESNTFDRVLVDVPCTTDRHSLLEEENNIFTRSRSKERQTLPLLQSHLLLAGIKAALPGGVVLYSTCTLSQLQNECVVERAVQVAHEELGVTVHIEDLSPLTQLFRDTFNFAQGMRLGELVLPHLTSNFGPTYFCKLRRVN
ncbi:5-methylcytosine rRNA methyltransferase NSUN4 isoform X1 [Huso huso]|uniref:5-cytosine rRNA methyltransferase NSUN4 n=1 Tax=Huso huso TaxID=61971 RepID=A0ABR0ZHK6_HUSHU